MMAYGSGASGRARGGEGAYHTRYFPVEIKGKEIREERRQLDQ